MVGLAPRQGALEVKVMAVVLTKKISAHYLTELMFAAVVEESLEMTA